MICTATNVLKDQGTDDLSETLSNDFDEKHFLIQKYDKAWVLSIESIDGRIN